MGKVKKGGGRVRQPRNAISDNEEYADAIDPTSSDFIYDAVDKHYENEDRQGAQKLAKLMKRPKPLAQDDVLGVASSSEDEQYEKPKKRKKGKKGLAEAEPLPPLDSDLEDEKAEDQEDDNIGKPWGKKKKDYYNADYVEDWDDAHESEAEVAELEEQEALAIQQRMAQQLEEADFGLDFITHLKSADKVKERKPAVEEEKIDVNLSQLSKREKLKLLNEESPELLELAEDFKMQMMELKEKLQPLLKLVADGVLPPSPGVEYIKAKYNIIISYCAQIGFYFVLKSKRLSVQNHPVIKRLVQFRSLLHQLENAGANLESEIDDIRAKIKNGKSFTRDEFVRTIIPASKKLRILSNRTSDDKIEEVNQKEKKPTEEKKLKPAANLTRDEENALEFYKAVRQKGKKKKDEDESSEDESGDDNPPAEDAAPADEAEEMGKRAINYQISKNKGLTPHRPKEQRNPRVKHRMKFRKANIRRKGQFREPRKELKKYGGEMSGIKATVVRSVKLK